jgi:hypothetical protein
MRHRERRGGQTSLAALIVLPMMLGILFLTLYLFRTRDSLTELRNAGVATSLAAVEALADDDLLTDRPDRIRPLLDRAAQNALVVSRMNLVEGRRVEIKLPDADGKSKAKSDVVFGTLPRAVGGKFARFDADKASPVDWGQLNAVELTIRQPEKSAVFTTVTAVLDRAVIGFRPWGDKPSPLAPIALYDGADNEFVRWSDALVNSPDEMRRSPGKAFVDGTDALPEVLVRVGRQPSKAVEVFGLPFVARTTPPTVVEVATQVRHGLTTTDLSALGGELLLPESGLAVVPVEPDLLRQARGESSGANDDPTLAAFRELAATGEARVWPLFATVDDHGRAVLTGFTAARVVSVTRDGPHGLVLRLQPSVLASPTAVTDPARTTTDGKPFGNRNVVKVRLAG